MIGAILRKELTEFRRDGRVLASVGLMSFLVVVGLITGWATHTEQAHQVRQSQRDDQAIFVQQGEKPPHSAAHFGRMAFKPAPPLAVFDPGAAPYVGQVIWLEAHRQDPAMFRPAEDAPELRRLADLSVAGVLAMLVPLILFLLGHGAFAGERERGTLRHVISSGLGLRQLFVGKIIAVAGIGVILSLIAVATSTAIALAAAVDVSAWDTVARGVGLFMGYAAYSLAFAAIAFAVSSWTRSTTSALLILLSLWAMSVVILPRVAAAVAQHLHPTPDSGVFWSEASAAIRKSRPPRDSEEYRAIERMVLNRMLGREVGAEQAASIEFNRRGLNLEVGEILEAKAYAQAYRDLYETYANQQRVRRLFSMLSPTIVLQHLSGTLAGTDISAHRHFALAAERQRRVIIGMMNEDMMMQGAGRGDSYLSSPDLWRRIPNFDYHPPSVAFAARRAAADYFILVMWSAAAFWLAWRASYRQSVA